MNHLNAFVDGFILPFEKIARVSGYLDGVGRRLADWLVAQWARRAA